MVWKSESQIEKERIESKIDNSIFKKKSNSKTFSGWLIAKIKQARDQGNQEMVFLLYEIYKKYHELEVKQVKLKGWKGKSSIKIINKPDLFIIITYQKADQDSEPKEIRREITKNQVNHIINAINQLDEGKPIPSREIGQFAFRKHWDKIFSSRPTHTSLNLILRLLDYYGVIKYRAGKSTVINKVKEIQSIL